MGYEPVHYRRVFLDDEDMEVEPAEKDGGGSLNRRDGDEASHGDGGHSSDQSYRYSDDHESYSDDSECDTAAQQETGVMSLPGCDITFSQRSSTDGED